MDKYLGLAQPTSPQSKPRGLPQPWEPSHRWPVTDLNPQGFPQPWPSSISLTARQTLSGGCSERRSGGIWQCTQKHWRLANFFPQIAQFPLCRKKTDRIRMKVRPYHCQGQKLGTAIFSVARQQAPWAHFRLMGFLACAFSVYSLCSLPSIVSVTGGCQM